MTELKCPFRKDGPVKCTWEIGTQQSSPHQHEMLKQQSPILDSILEYIGNTPMIRLNRIPKQEGLECEIVAKCEFFNAGGSVKDRIGKRMVEDAEKTGAIQPGATLIEPTSGNTGIGLALSAALKGYKMIITLPEKMSNEKVNILKALGAQVIRTPTEAAFDSPESHIGVAQRLNSEIPNSKILDQYGNPSNPIAHYDTTATEILAQTSNQVEVVVITAGTGGTVTGIARKLKEVLPNVKIVAVDPRGSILAQPDSLNDVLGTYQVEGIGYDFIPNVLDRCLVDYWIKSDDKESFQMARRLIKDEGLLCGGSSGAATWAAIEACKHFGLKAGQRCVVLLPDSVRNYMTKFLSDNWMKERGFLTDNNNNNNNDNQHHNQQQNEIWWHKRTIADLKLALPCTINANVSCKDGVEILKQQGFDQLPVVEDGTPVGVLTAGNLISKLSSRRIEPTDPVRKVLFSQFKTVNLSTTLFELSEIFDKDHFVLVVSTQKCFESINSFKFKTQVVGVATRIDLLQFITSQ
eukprot:TRINITY_DN2216_c0_g1_i1.p1 TRINITY_DN2216_c0_g1~~TRINITY_DN2216_c0_g1_i1.p1  ORF type:complete len:521 (-),score=283.68 TRINITY_DN2216_c0_g1_i1:54-1616(-)